MRYEAHVPDSTSKVPSMWELGACLTSVCGRCCSACTGRGIGLSGLGGPRQRRKALEHSAKLEGRVPEGLAGEGAALLTGRGDVRESRGDAALGQRHMQQQVESTAALAGWLRPCPSFLRGIITRMHRCPLFLFLSLSPATTITNPSQSKPRPDPVKSPAPAKLQNRKFQPRNDALLQD